MNNQLVRRKKRRVSTKKRKTVRKDENGLLPILGVHTKYGVKVGEEIKPPFDKKTQKKLKRIRY